MSGTKFRSLLRRQNRQVAIKLNTTNLGKTVVQLAAGGRNFPSPNRILGMSVLVTMTPWTCSTRNFFQILSLQSVAPDKREENLTTKLTYEMGMTEKTYLSLDKRQEGGKVSNGHKISTFVSKM